MVTYFELLKSNPVPQINLITHNLTHTAGPRASRPAGPVHRPALGYVSNLSSSSRVLVVVHLKQIEYGVYGDLIITYPMPYSIYVRGIISAESFTP